MKLLSLLSVSATIASAAIECGQDPDEVGCVRCKNIPQNLAGLDAVDLSSLQPIDKLKLILEDEQQSQTTDTTLLKNFLANVQTTLLELHLIRFNSLLTNSAIADLQHLQSLNIVKSALPSLPDFLFEGLSNLNTVTIKEADLTTINEAVFDDSTQQKFVSPIKKLKFESCNIGSLTDRSLFHLKNLEVFDVSGNNINAIESSFLKWCIHLKKVDFSSNGITNLSDDLFKYNRDLRAVDFYNNDISELPCELFKWQIDLKEVNLTSNALDHIQCHWIIRQGRYLKAVDYSNNLFHKAFAQLLEHTRGVHFKLQKKFIKTESGEKAEKKQDFICQQCEKNLPPRKKLKLKTDEWQLEKKGKWADQESDNL